MAVSAFTDDLQAMTVGGDPMMYHVGTMPSRDPDRPHAVVVAAVPRDSTRNSAAISINVARSFPGLDCIVLCGIAGGLPGGDRVGPAVRLGDVVTAAEGIVDYDHVRSIDGLDRPKRSTDGLSSAMLRADHAVQSDEVAGRDAFSDLLEAMNRRLPAFRRPSPGRSRVHRGAIGSADRLIRDTRMQETLAARYDVQAVEMEASGIAAGASLHKRNWYVVRGIADYSDGSKDDRWHPYAAAAAAAYTRVLLGECSPFPEFRPPPARSRVLVDIVDALSNLSVMGDDYQRRAVMATLPTRIRSDIPESLTARQQIVSMVQTCMSFPDGVDALLDALRFVMGDNSPELQRVSAAILAASPESDRQREPPA